MYQHVSRPLQGRPITRNQDLTIQTPDWPIIPFIEGDGVGADVMPVMREVVDAAVQRAYRNQRKIEWMEVYAGESAIKRYGVESDGLPQETLDILKDCVVSIKGPLGAPRQGGVRSLNVALRQALDLYVCLRPVQYFEGVPAPVKEPEKVAMTIFRENSEDIYAGIEFEAGSAQAHQFIQFLSREMGVTSIRFPETSGIGIKPVSVEGTRRLMRQAIQYAIDHNKPSVTIVHKGNIMKYTEGSFRDWAYQLAQNEFDAKLMDGGPWCSVVNPKTGARIVIKDSMMDSFLQHILLRPAEHSVIATLNLNGDYISDALAAQVGGVGIAPCGNLSDTLAMFEVTHGPMSKYAGKDYVNPSSAILSAEMMLRYIGWHEAADTLVTAMAVTIQSKKVTYDLARLMDGASQVSCSGFGREMIANM